MLEHSNAAAPSEQSLAHRAMAGLPELMSHWAFPSLLLAVAAVALYWPATGFDFVNFDDHTYFAQNREVTAGLSWDGFVWALGSFHTGNWHPLTWLSFMLDATLFGGGPAGPHFTNLILHAANGVLLFLLLRQLTGANWRSALVAGLFVCHPLNVESVAWVSERKNVLSTLFWLLATMAYVAHARGVGSQGSNEPQAQTRVARRPSLPYWLAVGLFALGLMSKPMLVTLPFVLLLLDYWPLGRWRMDAPGWHRQLLRLTLEKAPFFLLTALMCGVTLAAQHYGKALQSIATYPLGARIENALISCCLYLGKAFWPANLAVFYPHTGHWPPVTVAAALFLGAACVAAVRLGRRWPFVFTGWFWFLGTLIPVVGLVQVGHQSMADRYAYVPAIGIFILLSWGAAAAATRWKLSGLMTATAGLALIAAAVCTRHQLGYWQNDAKLFRHALAVTPNNDYLTCMALTKIGSYLHQNGLPNEAMEYYHAVIQIDPDYLIAHVQLGLALDSVGRLEEAADEYAQAIRIDPDNYAPRFNLGSVLARLGRRDEAIEQFRQVLRIKPGTEPAIQRLQGLGVSPPY
jgi:protein O-mannosyl-transferase